MTATALIVLRAAKSCRSTLPSAFLLLFAFLLASPTPGFAQKASGWQLEKWPVDLETDYALSALPLPLRKDATVYLLDPQIGYYVGRQGSNGFICFIDRTDWELPEFSDKLATPISYDAEGARSIFPVYTDVAAMRASGKFQAAQIRDTIKKRILSGVYKAPAKPGISYMLAPVMRIYPDGPNPKEIITVSYPHYMLYAPYFTEADVRFKPGTEGLQLVNSDKEILGNHKGPFAYVIIPAGNKEKGVIMEDGKDLLKRLTAYKPYFKVEEQSAAHHHGTTAGN